MWIQKSNQELKNELRARRLGAGLGLVCVAFLLFVFGFSRAGFNPPISARIAALLMAAVMFVAWYRRAHWRRTHLAVWVCDQCNLVKAHRDQPGCACGGTPRRLSDMKWIEVPMVKPEPPDDHNIIKNAVAIQAF